MNLSKLHLHWGACRRGTAVHKAYSLARSFRENGKNRKEIVYSLGKLSDTEADQWRYLLKLAKQPSVPVAQIAVVANRAYLDVAVVYEAWKFWGLSEIIDRVDKKRRDVPLSVLTALLTINRCIDPASKSQVPTWVKNTALDLLMDTSLVEINPSRIFRELEAIETCKDALVQHLFRTMNERHPATMKQLFYDLSSTTFTGSRCALMRWGHCKEGYDNHIVLALIVNAEGLPLYWEVLQGNTVKRHQKLTHRRH